MAKQSQVASTNLIEIPEESPVQKKDMNILEIIEIEEGKNELTFANEDNHPYGAQKIQSTQPKRVRPYSAKIPRPVNTLSSKTHNITPILGSKDVTDSKSMVSSQKDIVPNNVESQIDFIATLTNKDSQVDLR